MNSWTSQTRHRRVIGKTPPGHAYRSDFTLKPLFVEVLSDERWYQDGSPSWPKAPTANDAETERTSCVKRLRRFASEYPRAKRVAHRLENCEPHDRCMSGGCPSCLRAFQRWLVAETRQLAKQSKDQDADKLVAASVVFPDDRAPKKQLQKLDTLKTRRAFADAIREQEIVRRPKELVQWVVGRNSTSALTTTPQRTWARLGSSNYTELPWSRRKMLSLLHFAFIISLPKSYGVPSRLNYPTALRRRSRTDSKTQFVRRTAYWGKASPRSERGKCWQTRKVSLKPEEHVECLLWLDRIGIAGRLYLRGVRMTRTQNGVRLVLLKKPRKRRISESQRNASKHVRSTPGRQV